MKRCKRIRTIWLILIIASSLLLIPLRLNLYNNNFKNPGIQSEFIHSSAETVYNKEWLDNNNFSTQDDWLSSKGALGDNATVDANISGENANYIVIGDEQIKEISAPLNDGTWVKTQNDIFLYPDTATITSDGCYVYHDYDEAVNQARNYHSVHWKKNISMGSDMSKYIINSASLEVIFNATVDVNVDVANDNISPQFGIGDFATFYVLISDLDFTNPYRVANNKTSTLGQDSPPITTIPDKPIETVDEEDIITALSSSLNKDPDHSNFTITLGIDIYCEDNWGTDRDTWEALFIKSLNLTFSYERKVEKFSSVSWNQVGNTIFGDNIHVSDAYLRFKYTINQDWPTSLSPFSEIRIIINNNQYPETVRLSSANASSWKDAKVGGFDVTNLILKGVNISISLQVFIANTFSLDNNITISIDDVYLNITYVETFPDYETDYQLFLETLNKTTDRFIEIPYGDTVNITIKYQDNETDHISGANVQLDGKVSGELSEYGLLEQYSRIINSTNLGIGIWLLTITAEMLNYETQVIQLYIKVIERATEIELFVNSQNKTLDPYVQIEVNKIINLTVFYRDDETKAYLSGAEATLIDIGNFSKLGLQYNYTLNSTDLSLGFNVLSILVQLENYSAQNIQIYVEVYDIATELLLEVDELEIPTYPPETIQVQVNQLINITVFYKNNETKQYISGATVSLDWDNFTKTGTQYFYNLNTTTHLDQGITVVTIEAQLSTFQSQTVQIYFEVVERETEMEVYVEGFKRNETETIIANVNEVLNITVFYRDNISKTHLPGAVVTVLDRNFNETGNQYNYSLNTNSLDQGIAILTVIAYLENYQPQSFQFYVEVSERATNISLFLNSIDKTNDSVYELPIGSSLNITVKYSDNQTGAHISGGTVQLIGEDTYNINESLSQYTLILDTSILEYGTDLLTINAHANNYKVQSLSLWLTLNKRTTVINTTDGESYYSILPSDSFSLAIELTDVYFGGTINNAIVTYKWAYGQGNLTDPDNNGIYEGKLENVPAGTYEIIITASAGDNYNFENYKIILNVVSVSPPDFTLLFIALAGGLVAMVFGFTLYEVRFKYPATVRKSRKIRKKIKKGKKTKPIKGITPREDLINKQIESNVENIQFEKKIENELKEK
ncbi:MAG: hypothetical protein ACFFCG_04820 [Promethearchaeota archaeon]